MKYQEAPRKQQTVVVEDDEIVERGDDPSLKCNSRKQEEAIAI